MSAKPLNRRRLLHLGTASVGLNLLAPSTTQAQPSQPSAATDLDVRAWGAKGDGITFDTVAIQAAIDACAAAAGGRVLVPAGTFLTRTLRLKSNVTLFLEAGAILQGTPHLEDYEEIQPSYVCYTYSNRCLIYAEKAANLSILGKGTIDCQGLKFPRQTKHTDLKAGLLEWGESPLGVRLVECTNLTVRDVTIRNCPMAALRIEAARGVVLEGMRIENRVRISCDGVEIVSSSDVRVSNCHIESWDDAICIKSASLDMCRNITVTNCTISSFCNAVKLGTESNGGFENISITNCTIEGGETNGWRSINGIALMIVDGGTMNRINISNIVMQGVRTALFIHLGNRARPFSQSQPVRNIGSVKNISISNVLADAVDGDFCCSITGLPEAAIEDVVLDNVRVCTPGGRTTALRKAVPEKPKDYPESIMYGRLPAFGLFCRHVKGIALRNLQLTTTAPDFRPAIICDDVEDLTITGLEASNAGDTALVVLASVTHALIQACRPRARLFVSVEGARSAEIALLSNDLRRVETAITRSSEVRGTALELNNLRR